MTARLSQPEHNTCTARVTPLAAADAWYVLQTKPRQEYRAQVNLRNQQYEVFLPEYQKEIVRRGRVAWREEPLFCGYIFVRLNEIESNWAPIRSTRGISKVVKFGDGPLPVAGDLIKQLQASSEYELVESRFKSGDAVMVRDGPFRGVNAIYDNHDGEERAFIFIELLHRIARVSLERGLLAQV